MGPRLLLDADWYGVAQAMYSPAPDLKDWAEVVVERVQSLVRGLTVGVQVVHYDDDAKLVEMQSFASETRTREMGESVRTILSRMNVRDFRRFYFSAPMLSVIGSA